MSARQTLFLNLKLALLGSVILLFPLWLQAQTDSSLVSDLDRTFMPAIQMGYVFHGTPELSGGLMIQTSLEYRGVSNFVFRINYDDFDANMNVEYPINPDLTFTGRMSFFEVIGGVGYRVPLKKHTLTGYIQPGFRKYGYPDFDIDTVQANLNFDSRFIGIARYSIGYEFAILPKLYFVVEALASHVFKRKDFWADRVWSYGVTVGISATLL